MPRQRIAGLVNVGEEAKNVGGSDGLGLGGRRGGGGGHGQGLGVSSPAAFLVICAFVCLRGPIQA